MLFISLTGQHIVKNFPLLLSLPQKWVHLSETESAILVNSLEIKYQNATTTRDLRTEYFTSSKFSKDFLFQRIVFIYDLVLKVIIDLNNFWLYFKPYWLILLYKLRWIYILVKIEYFVDMIIVDVIFCRYDLVWFDYQHSTLVNKFI